MIDFAPAFVQPPEMPGNKFHALYAHPLPHLPRAVRFPDCSLQNALHAATSDVSIPRTIGTASSLVSLGSSLIYSKFLPHAGVLLILIPGARITSLPLPRASSPNTFPALRASLRFHVIAIALLLRTICHIIIWCSDRHPLIIDKLAAHTHRFPDFADIFKGEYNSFHPRGAKQTRTVDHAGFLFQCHFLDQKTDPVFNTLSINFSSYLIFTVYTLCGSHSHEEWCFYFLWMPLRPSHLKCRY